MRQKHVISILAFAVVGLLAVSGYFAYQARHAKPVEEADEAAGLAEMVGKKAELPAGEMPTVATVTNRDRLDGQVFFKSAENGDKILIYPHAGWAVLYRPSTGKVLEMTGIDIEKYADNTAPSARTKTGSDAPAAIPVPITATLYNGTMDTGALDAVARTIADRFPTVTVSARQAASKRDYEESFVVDLSGGNSDMASLVAQAIGGTVMPHMLNDEVVPGTDLLIVVGKAR